MEQLLIIGDHTETTVPPTTTDWEWNGYVVWKRPYHSPSQITDVLLGKTAVPDDSLVWERNGRTINHNGVDRERHGGTPATAHRRRRRPHQSWDNGNLMAINAATVTTYTYNQRNLLTAAWQGAVQLAGYLYDGNGNRVRQVDYTGSQPITTTYTNDNLGLSQVLVANNGITTTHNIFGLDLISQQTNEQTSHRYLLADGLGSVRTEIVDGAVETVTTYEPYGNLLAQTGTSGTVYGFTGEQHDAATGLLYLRARYYNPYIYRMVSPDTIVPDFLNPQSLNKYTYVLNSPVNFSDPTGHRECGTPNDIYCDNRPTPEWWTNGTRRVFVEGYGVFDKEHIQRGYRSAQWFKNKTWETIARGGGMLDEPASSIPQKYWLIRTIGGYYEYKANYWVSGKVTYPQLEGVVAGMYMDFEIGYEEHQAKWVDFYSAYAPEDFPSDYIGFWAYLNGKNWNQVPSILEELGRVTPWKEGSVLMDTIVTNQALNQMSVVILCFPRNYEFMPMAQEITDHGGGVQETRWKNKPWPKWLELTQTPSGPNTWMRVE